MDRIQDIMTNNRELYDQFFKEPADVKLFLIFTKMWTYFEDQGLDKDDIPTCIRRAFADRDIRQMTIKAVDMWLNNHTMKKISHVPLKLEYQSANQSF